MKISNSFNFGADFKQICPSVRQFSTKTFERNIRGNILDLKI